MPDLEQNVPMPFPINGIDVSVAYSKQPEQSTPEGVNVRGYEPGTQRQRGGSRAGISKFIVGQVAAGDIQCLDTVVWISPDALLDGVEVLSGTDDPSSGARNPGRTVRTGGSGRQPNRNVSNKKKRLTITARSYQKPTGGDFRISGKEFDAVGLQGADSVDSVTLTCSGFAAGAAPGPYAIVPSSASGSGLSNYRITYAPGTLTVTNTPTGPLTHVRFDCSVVVGITPAGAQNASNDIPGPGQFSQTFTFDPGTYPLLNQTATITMTASVDNNGAESYIQTVNAPGLHPPATVYIVNNSWIWGSGPFLNLYAISGVITG
jgi:hypothetical protein